jgi:predicted acyl esterase
MDHLVTANRFLAGHRLRVVVQTGAQEFESDSVRAGDIRIGHAAGRVSYIVLPVVPLGDR